MVGQSITLDLIDHDENQQFGVIAFWGCLLTGRLWTFDGAFVYNSFTVIKQISAGRKRKEEKSKGLRISLKTEQKGELIVSYK